MSKEPSYIPPFTVSAEAINLIAEISSAETVGSRLGISGRMVRKHISVLREAGIIERIGGNKTGYWKILKKY